MHPPGKWTVVNKRGKVRGVTGPGGKGGGGYGGSGGGDPVSSRTGSAGGSSGGARQRTKLKPMETRANFSERPNTG